VRPLHSAPGHTQHFTSPCDEHVPERFCEQLYAPSPQTAVTGGFPLPMHTALDGIEDAEHICPFGPGEGVGPGVGSGLGEGVGAGSEFFRIEMSVVTAPVTFTSTSVS
jgi:hypothetical protein